MQQVHPLIHLLLHLSLRPSAPALPPPPPAAAAAAASVGPVQLNQSLVYTTAQREPPPAPSNWTSPMSGECSPEHQRGNLF